jgi:hypothetical protein
MHCGRQLSVELLSVPDNDQPTTAARDCKAEKRHGAWERSIMIASVMLHNCTMQQSVLSIFHLLHILANLDMEVRTWSLERWRWKPWKMPGECANLGD